ncbi:MAG TPA: NAD(P)/FAD-dependent oxidoreductase [Ktedonobacterales bacterium]|jgi:2-polyprenyl-6-methoxyphenol hydroxylase-like FAD-dependent oxidoreductase
MDRDYDVVIVGARVAGASLAMLLGQEGHRVLLIDRDTFPSDTLSTHLVAGFGVHALQRLGVLDEVLAAGFRRITRARTWVEDCLFEGPAGPNGAYSLAPRRDALDAILIRHATERGGVEFHQRTQATGLIEEDGRVVGVTLQSVAGERREVRARVVVGADGKYSKVADWVNAERYDAVPALRPGYYGYYHGVVPLAETTVELFFAHNQIGFVFPMRPGEDCLALELQPEEFEAFRANPRANFEERFRALPGMAARMETASLEGKIQGVRGIENYLRKPYGPGWALTGDAGYLKDPSTGLGIGDALAQAFMLAEALDSVLRGADWDASLGAYHAQRDKVMAPMYRWTLGATRVRDASPNAINWLRAALVNPHFTRQLMYWLPTVLSGELPPHLQTMMTSIGQAFDAYPQTEPESLAANM